MKIAVVSAHLPLPEGNASGRSLLAWCEGAIALGHDVEVWVWHPPAHNLPVNNLPPWCRYEPLEEARRPMWREHLVSVFSPRSGLRRSGWRPPEGAVVVAEDQNSGALVERLARSVATIRNREVLDALALRELRASALQWERAERRTARRVRLTLVHSARVGRLLPGRVRVVPIACRVPTSAVELTDEPVAVMTAHWAWPPNQTALSWLLAHWPTVRQAVPGARLVLGGRGLPKGSMGHIDGVTAIGEFAAQEDILSMANLMVFPSPPSSGPKIKVLQAMAHGMPVITTPAGVEGLRLDPGQAVCVANLGDFTGALVDLLRSPARRSAMARAARGAIEANHSPLVSARARIEAFSNVFGEDVLGRGAADGVGTNGVGAGGIGKANGDPLLAGTAPSEL